MIAMAMKIKVSFSPVKIGNYSNPCPSWQFLQLIVWWFLSLLKGS